MIYKVIKVLTNSNVNDITIVLGGESVGDFIRLLGSKLHVYSLEDGLKDMKNNRI